jgi:hypothetical protein
MCLAVNASTMSNDQASPLLCPLSSMSALKHVRSQASMPTPFVARQPSRTLRTRFENNCFDLDTQSVPRRPPTPVSKSNAFLGHTDDILGAGASMTCRCWWFRGSVGRII